MFGSLRRMLSVSRPRVVGPVTAGHGVNEFFSIVIPPIIPLLVSDLGITYGQAGFLVTVFFIMYSLFQLPAGILADWLGKRRMMVVGLAGMSGGVLIASTATGYEMLLVAQAVTGISGSTFHPTGMSIISDIESEGTEGKAMGVFGFGGALGTMSSPIVVGGLASIVSWRAALGGAAVLGLLVTISSAISLRRAMSAADAGDETTDEKQVRSDGGHSSGLNRLREGLAGLFDVPRTRSVALLFALTLVLSIQHRAIQTYTTSYVTAETGAAVSIGNLAFFTLLVGGSLASLWAGDLADRFSRELLGAGAAIATAVLVAGTLLVAPLLGGAPTILLVGVLAVWFAVIGVGMYASYPVKNALVSETAESGYSGSLFGIIQTASAIGSAAGPAIFGVLATRWGVVAAFPAIAVSGLVLAGLFAMLFWSE
ncbi:MAG: MFS transporter [Natronomonas sp.]